MVDRGADHIKALCVVAAALAERAWAVLRRGMPYVICDTNATPEQAKKIIAEQRTVTAEVRARRRSTKTTNKTHNAEAGKAPQQVLAGQERSDAPSADKRGDLPRERSSSRPRRNVKPTTS